MSQGSNSDSTHIRATAEQARLRGMQTQLEVASTLCGLADIELAADRVDAASRMCGKVREAMTLVQRHLNEPNALPSATRVRGEGLAKIEQQVSVLEARLKR